MADHNKPVLTSTYANFVSELDARFDDLSLGLDPAVTSATNLPVNAIRWNSVLAKDQKWNGSTWADKSSFYALGSVRFNNGTAGVPSITFNDDTTTGIFKPTSQSIGFAVSGIETVRLNTSGSLLIGTTIDFARLAVNGSIYTAAGNDVQLGNVINSNAASISCDSTDTSASLVFKTAPTGLTRTERMRITNDGNLLLGTATNTGRKLEVNGSARISGRLDVIARSVLSGATGNDYLDGSLEILGGGTGQPTVFPTIGFHNPGLFAGSLRQNNASNFGFYTQGGVSRANLDVASLYASSQVYASDGFLTTAYVVNQRNPIWRFGDSPLFGISYFQGTAGYNGTDSIGVHFGTLNGGSATGQGSHVTFNKDGVIAKRFQGVADQSNNLKVTDPEDNGESRTLAHITPQSVARNIRADFASGTGTGSLYSGVLTFSPYDGTTASTGGPSYQLAFGSASNNGGEPRLRLRNGIDTTWNSYIDVVTSANISNCTAGSALTASTVALDDNSTKIANTSWVRSVAAPKPTTTSGAIGEYRFINNGVLPAGGTWAYYNMQIADDGNVVNAVGQAGIAAGGTTISGGGTGGGGGGQGGNYGFAWRIA